MLLAFCLFRLKVLSKISNLLNEESFDSFGVVTRRQAREIVKKKVSILFIHTYYSFKFKIPILYQ
jgi:hypothetical protein